jgi:hypothetical protein
VIAVSAVTLSTPRTTSQEAPLEQISPTVSATSVTYESNDAWVLPEIRFVTMEPQMSADPTRDQGSLEAAVSSPAAAPSSPSDETITDMRSHNVQLPSCGYLCWSLHVIDRRDRLRGWSTDAERGPVGRGRRLHRPVRRRARRSQRRRGCPTVSTCWTDVGEAEYPVACRTGHVPNELACSTNVDALRRTGHRTSRYNAR